MSRQRRADDRVRAGYVVGQTVAGRQIDVTAALFEMRDAVGLEQYLDERMAAGLGARRGMRQPMLTRLDLAQFQLRNRRVVDPALERRSLERVDVEMAAQIGQGI